MKMTSLRLKSRPLLLNSILRLLQLSLKNLTLFVSVSICDQSANSRPLPPSVPFMI